MFVSNKTLRLILRFFLRTLGNMGMILLAIYSAHLARRSFGPRPKVLSRQYRKSAPEEFSGFRKSSLHPLLTDVKTSSEAVINRSLNGIASEEPTTTVNRLRLAATLRPKSTAFMVPDFQNSDDAVMKWKKALTWEEYWVKSRNVAKALMSLKFDRHDTAMFVSESRPEFFVCWMGVQAAGGVCSSGHPWSSPSELLRFSEPISPKIAFVDSPHHVTALKSIRSLEKIVLISNPIEFQEFCSLGKYITEERLNDERIQGIRPGHASCVLFSSGQSLEGRPKPILLSHDNVTFSARAFLRHHENVTRWGIRHPFDDNPGEDRTSEHILSFLPLSHVGTLVLDLHVPMCLTSFESYAPCTLWTFHKSQVNPQKRDTLYPALVTVRPTIFLGMPAVWDRFRRLISTQVNSSFLLSRALALGASWFTAVQAGSHGTEPVGLYYAERYVFLSIKKKFGLDRAKLLISSGAPIAKDQLEFFGSLGMHIMESFGATGCSGPQTMGRQDYFICGNVGVSLPSCELKIVPVPEYYASSINPMTTEEEEEEEDNNHSQRKNRSKSSVVGEICVRGRHVCMGVLNDPEMTSKILDEDGFFHTNHIGRLDQFGCLELIGRRDELVGFTAAANSPASGKKSKFSNSKMKIGLSFIEAELRDKARPIIDRVVVVQVKNDITACKLRVFATLRREVIEEKKLVGKELLKRVQQAVDNANLVFGSICKIDSFLLLPPGVKFSAFGEDPELTLTGQARRSVVVRKYQREFKVLTSDGFDSMSQQ